MERRERGKGKGEREERRYVIGERGNGRVERIFCECGRC